MAAHLRLIQGNTERVAIDLVDASGEPLPLASLKNATATFVMRVQPTDIANVLLFDTLTTPSRLAFDPLAPVLNLAFAPTDTAPLALGRYLYRVQLTLATGDVFDTPPWSEVDLVLGGAADVAPPAFDNTVKITADYPLPDDMTYRTPGGSPIEGAQVRVYKKSDYDAGLLATPVGVTTTDAGGKWTQALLVTTGYTYVARLEKPYEYGPDVKEFVA